MKEVQDHLDIREMNGYSIRYTSFLPADSSQPPIENCLVYIGLPDNPQFLGVQDPEDLAQNMSRSRGLAGDNKDYLFMLDEALKDLGEGSGDEHIEDLAKRVRILLEKREGEGERKEEEATRKTVRDNVSKLQNGTVTDGQDTAIESWVEPAHRGDEGVAV